MKINLLMPFLLLAALHILFSACCKDQCEDQNNIKGIEFHNFPIEEVDSFYVLRFTQSSNFSSLIDSDLINTVKAKDDYFWTEAMLPSSFDYEVSISALGRRIRISEIQFTERKCNNGCIGNVLRVKFSAGSQFSASKSPTS